MILVLWSSIGAGGGGDESVVAIDLKYGDGMLPATKCSVERQLYAIEIQDGYYGNVPIPARQGVKFAAIKQPFVA